MKLNLNVLRYQRLSCRALPKDKSDVFDLLDSIKEELTVLATT